MGHNVDINIPDNSNDNCLVGVVVPACSVEDHVREMDGNQIMGHITST